MLSSSGSFNYLAGLRVVDSLRSRPQNFLMHRTLVMTLLGPDKSGLVEKVSSLVQRHSGNWLESRLAHLAGHFAGIVSLSLPEEEEEAFRRNLKDLEAETGLSCVVADSEKTPSDPGQLYHLDLVGQDRLTAIKADPRTGYAVNMKRG